MIGIIAQKQGRPGGRPCNKTMEKDMLEGNRVDPREKRYQFVGRTICFLFNKHQVLLIKGSENRKRWAGLYNGIGGHVEKGESIMECARRELSEEAGVDGAELDLVSIITIDNGNNPGICLFVYRGEYDGDVSEGSDEGSIEWVDMANIENLQVVQDLPGLLGMVFRYQKGDDPTYFKYSFDSEGKLGISRG
jgi:8-oxo-dGTP diphosphatase